MELSVLFHVDLDALDVPVPGSCSEFWPVHHRLFTSADIVSVLWDSNKAIGETQDKQTAHFNLNFNCF